MRKESAGLRAALLCVSLFNLVQILFHLLVQVLVQLELALLVLLKLQWQWLPDLRQQLLILQRRL